MDSIATKDIAIAAFSGAAAIASVLLVFMGFMAVKADSLPNETPDAVVGSFTRLAKFGLIPLLAEVLVMLAAYAWMFSPSRSLLFYTWAAGFPVASVVFVIYSVIVTLRL